MARVAEGRMTALAIFAKTPGLSPVKTRLAQAIGARRAAMFHRLAAASVGEVAACCRGRLAVHWAVAEAEALRHPAWAAHPALWQGEGGLGERLHHVYATLQGRHGAALLIGCDTPHLTAALLLDAGAALRAGAAPFLMGRALDGGFWLFGGRVPIRREAWLGVQYSDGSTAAQLAAALGGVSDFVAMSDVDHAADLPHVLQEIRALPAPVRAQRRLARWLERLRPACGAEAS